MRNAGARIIEGLLHPLQLWGRLQQGDAFKAALSEIASPWGHDSFLLPVPAYHQLVRDFLAGKR